MYIWWSNSGLDIFLLTQINVYQEVTSKRYQYSLFRVSWLFTNMSFPFSHLEKTSIFLAWNSKFLTWVGWEKTLANVSVVSVSFICIVSLLLLHGVNFAKTNTNYRRMAIFTQKQIHNLIIFYPGGESLGRRRFSTKDCMLPACDNLSDVGWCSMWTLNHSAD